MSGETLKPCPWCNSKAVLWKADNHEEWFIGCGGECSVNPGRHFDTREDAITAWNTRPREAELEAEMGRLRVGVRRALTYMDPMSPGHSSKKMADARRVLQVALYTIRAAKT